MSLKGRDQQGQQATAEGHHPEVGHLDVLGPEDVNQAPDDGAQRGRSELGSLNSLESHEPKIPPKACAFCAAEGSK